MQYGIANTSYWSALPKSNPIFVEQIVPKYLHQLRYKLQAPQESSKEIHLMIWKQDQSNC